MPPKLVISLRHHMSGDSPGKFLYWGLVLTISPQDRKNDEKAGVKPMAVHLGERICPALSVFDATFFACLPWAGHLNSQRLLFYFLLLFQFLSFAVLFCLMGVIVPFLLSPVHLDL
ncbi:uncharacterized protein BJ212DRAFT_1020279 [Suillus subaureus]|uniref:Uncharacterized protein n=1 Tax=Suillus subaureus TaxID=48587 RepID=A0A9P7JFN3_9AGAM|nr:uncharacterized protein BJ212DRAFT_1020279 [Suillus subaureus]KAG1820335.1 hypothetical protein BJ212DRAFT_1020279 [Suillus subaureus]